MCYLPFHINPPFFFLLPFEDIFIEGLVIALVSYGKFLHCIFASFVVMNFCRISTEVFPVIYFRKQQFLGRTNQLLSFDMSQAERKATRPIILPSPITIIDVQVLKEEDVTYLELHLGGYFFAKQEKLVMSLKKYIGYLDASRNLSQTTYLSYIEQHSHQPGLTELNPALWRSL
jgi:hypothetical protein